MPPLKFIIEAALFAADKPLNLDHLVDLFTGPEQPERSLIRAALRELRDDYTERGIELMQVASGYRFQTQESMNPWLKRLQPERAPRYSRALLETLAIIAYRQPITRSEIEKIRGISVSTDLVKRLLDYNWIRILAHRDSPGRPALYGTTRTFLDYFNLKNLSDLPTLIELQEMVLPSDIFESESEGPEDETPEAKENSDTEAPDAKEKLIPDETPEAKDNSDIKEPDSKENPIQVITEEVQTISNDTPTSEASSINVIVERLENEIEGKEEKTGTTEEESERPEQETLDTKDNEDTKGDIEEPDSKENPIQVITEEVQTTSNDTPTSEAPPINVIVERLENEMEGKEEKTGTTDELETGTHAAEEKESETPPEDSEKSEMKSEPNSQTEIKPTTDVLNSESKDQTEAENVDEQLILFQEPANTAL